jgi:SAM-dependent methyltransferase
MTSYSPGFYADLKAGSRRSAAVVVPLLVELLGPRSVVDVGCGVGTWLAEFARCGVDDYLGVDAESVPRQQLSVPAERFRAADLAAPLELGRRFDLALCLEVAEHLPPAAALTLVTSLAALAPVIVFSAAVPFQGGTQHLNEQWPEYWAGLFAQRGFQPRDVLRARLWTNPDVEWWYAQNLLLYVDGAAADKLPSLPLLPAAAGEAPLPLVHPANYLQHADGKRTSLRRVLGLVPGLLWRRLWRR